MNSPRWILPLTCHVLYSRLSWASARPCLMGSGGWGRAEELPGWGGVNSNPRGRNGQPNSSNATGASSCKTAAKGCNTSHSSDEREAAAPPIPKPRTGRLHRCGENGLWKCECPKQQRQEALSLDFRILLSRFCNILVIRCMFFEESRAKSKP